MLGEGGGRSPLRTSRLALVLNHCSIVLSHENHIFTNQIHKFTSYERPHFSLSCGVIEIEI